MKNLSECALNFANYILLVNKNEISSVLNLFLYIGICANKFSTIFLKKIISELMYLIVLLRNMFFRAASEINGSHLYTKQAHTISFRCVATLCRGAGLFRGEILQTARDPMSLRDQC